MVISCHIISRQQQTYPHYVQQLQGKQIRCLEPTFWLRCVRCCVVTWGPGHKRICHLCHCLTRRNLGQGLGRSYKVGRYEPIVINRVKQPTPICRVKKKPGKPVYFWLFTRVIPPVRTIVGGPPCISFPMSTERLSTKICPSHVSRLKAWRKCFFFRTWKSLLVITISHRIHVWYICLHLVVFDGACT